MKRSLFLTVLTVILTFSGQQVWGQIPQTMSYQGVLTNAQGTKAPDGNYHLTFKLYDAATDDKPLWSETQTVAVIDGVFKVILGAERPLKIPFDQSYWLGISVDEGAELTPRLVLTSSPYSLYARSVADSAITSSKIASGQVVRSINAMTDAVTLEAGENVTITQNGHALVISARAGWSGCRGG